MTLGDRLRKARDHAGLTQKQLEDKSGVSQKTISKIERGDQDNSTQVVQLARACGVSIDWLATETGDMVQGNRAEQPAAAYTTLSPAALELARAFDNLSPTDQDHVRRTVEMAKYSETARARRRAAAHDATIKRDALLPGARRKSKKAVR